MRLYVDIECNGCVFIACRCLNGKDNWLPFLELEPSRATQSNGRGIAKAALLSFDRVEFIGNGNTVKITTMARKN